MAKNTDINVEDLPEVEKVVREPVYKLDIDELASKLKEAKIKYMTKSDGKSDYGIQAKITLLKELISEGVKLDYPELYGGIVPQKRQQKEIKGQRLIEQIKKILEFESTELEGTKCLVELGLDLNKLCPLERQETTWFMKMLESFSSEGTPKERDLIKELIDSGKLNINQQTPSGITVAMSALLIKNTDFCKFIIELPQTDLSLRAKDNMSVLDRVRPTKNDVLITAIEAKLHADYMKAANESDLYNPEAAEVPDLAFAEHTELLGIDEGHSDYAAS